MAAFHSAHTNPLMSHTATCNLDDEKQFLFLLRFFNALPESLATDEEF